RLCHCDRSSVPLPSTVPGDCEIGRNLQVLDGQLAPGGRLIALGPAGAIRLCDTATGKVVRTIQYKDHETACAIFSPDGKWLAAGGKDGLGAAVRVWDTDTGKWVALLRGVAETSVGSLSFRADGRQLAGLDSKGNAYLWDLPGGQQRLCFP